jgi:cell wall-associated NlpC family hydrolase
MFTKKKSNQVSFILLATILFALACSVSTAPSDNPAPAIDSTKAALEMQATALALQMTQSALNAQQPPAQQPPTSAPVVNEAPIATAAPTATTTTSGCKDSARLVSEDPQDGGRVNGGSSFEKVWKLENTGACTWDSSYRLLFVEGAQLTGLKEVQPLVKNSIPSGSFLSIFITMRAPTTAGEFTTKWKWVNGKGETVPVEIGGTPSQFVIIRITVP